MVSMAMRHTHSHHHWQQERHAPHIDVEYRRVAPDRRDDHRERDEQHERRVGEEFVVLLRSIDGDNGDMERESAGETLRSLSTPNSRNIRQP